MPNRIIKESALNSLDLDKLSNGAERLFWRLTLVADDFGRFDANPQVVRARCFPTKVDSLRTREVENWMTELTPNLVRYYRVSGRPYGFFPNWLKHQQKRAKDSKFPEPPIGKDTKEAGDHDALRSYASVRHQAVDNSPDSNCNHLLANASEIEFENKDLRKPAKTVNKSPPMDKSTGPPAGSLERKISEKILRIGAFDDQASRDAAQWIRRALLTGRSLEIVLGAVSDLYREVSAGREIRKAWAYLDTICARVEREKRERGYKEEGDPNLLGRILLEAQEAAGRLAKG